MPKAELWHIAGPVEFGQYPYTYMGFGVVTETGVKVALATSVEFANTIVNDHNARLPTAQEQPS